MVQHRVCIMEAPSIGTSSKDTTSPHRAEMGKRSLSDRNSLQFFFPKSTVYQKKNSLYAFSRPSSVKTCLQCFS